jgi:hypothetical protein
MRFRKWHIILVVVIVILILTNPSLKSFQHHVNPEKEVHFYAERKSNFILFSIFRVSNGIYEIRYIGVLNHFILTKRKLQFL